MARLSNGARLREARDRLRVLFDEAAEVDWRNPVWGGFSTLLAASETLSGRTFSPERASDAFALALSANSEPAADTFMAARVSAPPADPRARIARALTRADAVARTLIALDAAAPDQQLLKTLRLRNGWLEPLRLASGVCIAFLVGDAGYVVDILNRDARAGLADELLRAIEGRPHRLRIVGRRDRDPTPAAAAIAIDPVPLAWARSFHRLAWTRGGGPWMGVADCAPHAVVSTCHAAVDGYIHARVTSSVLADDDVHGVAAARAGALPLGLDWSPPEVGFATRKITSHAPRFTTALHAFACVLDRRLGAAGSISVPFHVPIAPGDPRDPARWRRRPIYGLLALRKNDGRIESLEELSERLPAFLAREASGEGLLTRVLRAASELPVPASVRRRLIERQPWADRFLAPARVLTGGGYFSWMRFPSGEGPALPLYPSAVPSFSAHRGGAGLSITQLEDGALAIGLTTSGTIGSVSLAEEFLDEWIVALASTREHTSAGRLRAGGA